MFTTVCAYFLIVVFFLGVETRLRRSQEMKSFRGGEFDRGSTRLIGLAVMTTFVTLLLAPVLNHFQVGNLVDGTFVGWLGLVVMVGSLALRYWAAKTMGAFYTRTLLVKTEQHIVDSGPYRFVRHPGYLGFILMLVGAGLATINWVAVVIVTIVLLLTYAYRIRTEEAMLQTAFGEQYKAYMARSWRLVPPVY
jgi:protein-S-isoprenylcysteine O-methyltransferase Ste14